VTGEIIADNDIEHMLPHGSPPEGEGDYSLVAGQDFVFIENNAIVRRGDPFPVHAGTSTAATQSHGEAFVFIEDVPVVIAGECAGGGQIGTGAQPAQSFVRIG